jgi:hypothetical protein
VTEVHEEAIEWSAFAFATVRCVSTRPMRVTVAFAANVLNDVVGAESLKDMAQAESQSPAPDPRQPSSHLARSTW